MIDRKTGLAASAFLLVMLLAASAADAGLAIRLEKEVPKSSIVAVRPITASLYDSQAAVAPVATQSFAVKELMVSVLSTLSGDPMYRVRMDFTDTAGLTSAMDLWWEFSLGGSVVGAREKVPQGAWAIFAVDADTVDGMHASDLAPSGHTHDAAYVNVSGDAMPGSLAVGGTLSAGATTVSSLSGSGALVVSSGGGTDLTLDSGGAGAVHIGSADVTSVAVSTDGSGDGEVVLPAGAIGSTEILGGSVTEDKLAASLFFDDGDLLDLSAIDASSTAEGLRLPGSTNVSAATGEGQISWDTDNDVLYVGTGTAAVSVPRQIVYATDSGFGPLFVQCPPDTIVVGGGCDGQGNSLTLNCPGSGVGGCDTVFPNGWSCDNDNPAGLLFGYAICR